MPKQLPPSSTSAKEDAPATGLESALNSDTFEVSTRLTLSLLMSAIQELKDKLLSLESKIDTLLAQLLPRLFCIFCENNNEDGHRFSNCTVFSDAIARSLRLRDLNKCINCLAPAHGQCQHKCRTCGGPHHASS
ncbi:hypothetical protein RB195_023508 [Necator americanus]|uniref:CCHC-type domain-containing protein n=1 Tax=Necator americanus TaxID=51031 RepID=A0ABR1EJH7_NECAM